ncbi:hypothetical protein Tco_0720026 [Tanacetum coccineum]
METGFVELVLRGLTPKIIHWQVVLNFIIAPCILREERQAKSSENQMYTIQQDALNSYPVPFGSQLFGSLRSSEGPDYSPAGAASSWRSPSTNFIPMVISVWDILCNFCSKSSYYPFFVDWIFIAV